MSFQISARVSIDRGENRDARLAYPPCGDGLAMQQLEHRTLK
jgi:hypothetical protein